MEIWGLKNIVKEMRKLSGDEFNRAHLRCQKNESVTSR